MDKLITATWAARTLKRSVDTARRYADDGRLRVMRTEGGVRLFYADDVERLALELRSQERRGK